jgi:hypothetical protein
MNTAQPSALSPQPFSLTDLRPVFVVGHPRSGTTLLQLLITAHPAFWSAPETHLFSFVLADTPDWDTRLLRADELPILFARLAGKPGIALTDAVKAQITARAQESGGIAAAALLDAIMQTYAHAKPTATRWLEKTPRHVNFVPQMLKLFPDARVLNIVRDPRDVVSSNVRYQRLSPEQDAAQRRYICIERSLSWNTMVDYAKTLLPTEPRMMTLRYEDLITDPEGNLARVMAFIGEERDAGVLEKFGEGYRAVVLEKEDVHKQLCAVGEIVDRRGIWKTRMTEGEAQIVDTLCHALMGDYGYATAHDLIPLQVQLEKARYELPIELRRQRKKIYQKSRREAGKVLRRLGLR